MKKLLAIGLSLAMALGLAACGSAPAEEEAPAEETTEVVEEAPEVEATQLGTSCLSIVLPEGYALGEIEMNEDQVAYYEAGAEDMDFDVYQWVKDVDTVAEAAAEEVVDFDNAEVTEVDLNGIAAAYYEATEEWDGNSYKTLTYILDADTDFVELVFWVEGEDVNSETAQANVDAILASLAVMEAPAAAAQQLGTSCLSIVLPEGYTLGEDELDEDQVAYYCAGEGDMDFDVYQWTKDVDTVAEAAAEEVVDFDNAEVTEVDLNGVAAAYYEATENFEGEDFHTLTYILDADTDFVELVFWMDGANAQEAVDAILASVAPFEAAVTQMGTSNISITLPTGYALGEDEMSEDQVAYYCAGEDDMDFDVYQWTKDVDTVAEAAAEEVVDFDNAEVTEVDLNGVAAAYYEATESFEGADYHTLTYILDAGTDFVELVFWMDGNGAEEAVASILASVAQAAE